MLSFKLFPGQVLCVDVELVADVLVNLPIGEQREGPVEGVGFGERLGVFERDLHLEMSEIRTPVAFDDMSLKPMLSTTSVSRVPFRDGIAHPERVKILWMAASIEKQLAIAMNVALIENHDQRWSLNKLLREGRNPRHAGGKTMPFRIVFAQVGPAFFI